ncbi:MAG: S41 family peptidase [Verrucomicrobiales bacterium]|jgi:carboxyl-terminal processing protease|nr:S41 family peptidase [Verrucomicrobiales bacterium]
MLRFLMAAFLTAGVCGAAAADGDDDQDARYRSSLMVATVLEKIRQEYVDPGEVNYHKLTYSALEGMVSSLDPYCEFLDPRRYEEMRHDTEGEFGGLGIYIGVQNRTLVINMPIEGGPAFRAGVMPGDWIVKINGQATKGLSLSEAIRLLRGKTGEPITLVLFRPIGNETKEVTLTREIISVPTIRGTRVLNADRDDADKIGYLRITQFGDKTLDEFNQAMKVLLDKGRGGGIKALVLDLRNNPGGLLEVAVQVAGKFTPEGTVIVTTEGRVGANRVAAHQARGREHWLQLPLVVLINRHSASGAEIVAGSLKDLRRAILIGETSYGKGSVQTVQPLDPSLNPPVALRLTTARYYTPSHNPINKVGIAPDIEMPVTPEQERAVLRKQNLYLLGADEQRALEAVRDEQLDRAVTVLQGVMLFNRRRVQAHAAASPSWN